MTASIPVEPVELSEQLFSGFIDGGANEPNELPSCLVAVRLYLARAFWNHTW